MIPYPRPTDRFRYDAYELDRTLGQLTCRYSIGHRHYFEQITFDPDGDWSSPAVDAAARIVFLLAGVSYYKTSAPPIVDLGDFATTAEERQFLRAFYTEGLGEFAYENHLDLSGLEVVGPDLVRLAPAGYHPEIGHPLVPFGGGIDSIVSTESIRYRYPDTSLFIVCTSGDRFEAIERPAVAAGLPVARAEREIDPTVVRSTELGYLNGHVPVTGIISAIAVMAAILAGRDAVVISNEWSASVGNLILDGHAVNHQWSKSFAFERELRSVLRAAVGPGIQYFSLLRPYSELWVASRFATFPHYHHTFRSCNRAFHIDRAKRLDHWCGTCDKCCFIDLILSPFLPPQHLASIFDGHEPLANPSLEGQIRALLGNWPEPKPFECVGDVDECRAAVRLAALRSDRADNRILQTLAGELGPTDTGELGPADLLRPLGGHCIPDAYAPEDQLV